MEVKVFANSQQLRHVAAVLSVQMIRENVGRSGRAHLEVSKLHPRR
jgi:hypothetical protein